MNGVPGARLVTRGAFFDLLFGFSFFLGGFKPTKPFCRGKEAPHASSALLLFGRQVRSLGISVCGGPASGLFWEDETGTF